jgi:hypothetical protein
MAAAGKDGWDMTGEETAILSAENPMKFAYFRDLG